MGQSNYFEVWPDALARSLAEHREAWVAFDALWGRCSGMHGWFHEAPDELEEIAEASSQRGVDRVRELLATTPRAPNAFLYKSAMAHAEILNSAFTGPGAAKAVAALLFGEEPVEAGSHFSVTPNPRCRELVDRLSSADLIAATHAVVRLPDYEHRSADELLSELEQLFDMYRYAAEGGHRVITRGF